MGTALGHQPTDAQPPDHTIARSGCSWSTQPGAETDHAAPVAEPGVRRRRPGLAKLTVMNTVLGGGFNQPVTFIAGAPRLHLRRLLGPRAPTAISGVITVASQHPDRGHRRLRCRNC